MPEYEKIRRGHQLRDARHELGVRLDEVERFTEIPQALLQKWETGDAKIPRRHRTMLAVGLWVLACEKALQTSGLPDCGSQPQARDTKLGRAAYEKHLKTCPTCEARFAYARRAAGPPPFSVDGESSSPRWRTVQKALTVVGLLLAIGYVVLDRLVPADGGNPTLEELRRAVAENPEDAEAQYFLGLELMERERFTEALGPFRAAVALDSEDADPRNSLGWTLMQLGRPGEAVPVLQEAVELDPDHIYAWHNLGWALLGVGRYGDAVAAYKEAVRIAPSNPRVHYELGWALLEAGEEEAGIAEFQSAIALDSTHVSYHWALAGALKRVSRLDEALDAYQDALRVDPNNSELWGELGMLAAIMGEREMAIAAFERADSLNPEHFRERGYQRAFWEAVVRGDSIEIEYQRIGVDTTSHDR